MLVKADEGLLGDNSIDLGESPKKKLKFQFARKRDRNSTGTEEEEDDNDNFSENFSVDSNDGDFDDLNDIEEQISTQEVKENVIDRDVKKISAFKFNNMMKSVAETASSGGNNSSKSSAKKNARTSTGFLKDGSQYMTYWYQDQVGN